MSGFDIFCMCGYVGWKGTSSVSSNSMEIKFEVFAAITHACKARFDLATRCGDAINTTSCEGKLADDSAQTSGRLCNDM